MAFDFAAEHGITTILLRPTDRAVPLYHRAGFETADQHLVWRAPARREVG